VLLVIAILLVGNHQKMAKAYETYRALYPALKPIISYPT